MMNSEKKTVSIVSKKKVLAICAGALAVQMAAEAQPSQRERLEEIIVTAQRYEESVQDIPFSLTAIGAEELDRKGIETIADLRDVTIPGVTFAPFGGRAGSLVATMRGISTVDPSPGTLDPGVAIIVDDVYNARGGGLNMNVAEMERMEVLRGPQGTLFGRNAIGGAIRVVTKGPSGEFGGNAKVSFGNYGRRVAEAHINSARIGGLALKLDYRQEERDGFTKNAHTTSNLTKQRDFGEIDSWGGKISAEYEATDNLLFSYSYLKGEAKHTVFYSQHEFPPATCQAGPCSGASVLVGQPYTKDDRYIGTSWLGLSNDWAVDENEDHRFGIDWQINDNLALKSITTFSEVDLLINGNTLAGAYAMASFGGAPIGSLGFSLPGAPLGGTGLAAGGISSANEVYGLSGVIPWSQVSSETKSQEFQLSGFTDQLKWVTGAYWFEEKVRDARYSAFSIAYTGYDGTRPVNPVPIDPVSLVPPGFPAENNSWSVTNAEVEAWALFAQGTWTPAAMDRLHITLGLRYSDELREFSRSLNDGLPSSITQPDFDMDRVDGNFSVAYDLNETSNIYARYATAYRSGGASVRSPWTGPFANLAVFQEQVIESIEAGIKTDLFDNRLRLNAAAYYSEDDGTIFSVQIDPNNPSVTGTINLPGIQKIKGLEVEAVFAATDNLILSGNFTLQDYEFSSETKDYMENIDVGADYQNSPFPEWSGYLAMDYFVPLDLGEVLFHLDWSKSQATRGTSRLPPGGFAVNTRTNNINGKISWQGIQAGGMNLMVSFFGKNLTNEAHPAFAATTGQFVLNDPRTYGVELGLEF